MLKKTKIICTMGPTTEKEGILDDLIANGMNCARFNFSHGDHAEHLGRITAVREAAAKADKVISLILDTKGPEMRLGEFRPLRRNHVLNIGLHIIGDGFSSLLSAGEGRLPCAPQSVYVCSLCAAFKPFPEYLSVIDYGRRDLRRT